MLRLLLFCISSIQVVVGLNGSAYLFANESFGSPVVSTTSGQFAGFTIRQTNVWVGIPYAAPPVGALRWQKAQPYTVTDNETSTIRNATHYSASCPQSDSEGIVPGPFDEDCLYLNVWAPLLAPPSRSAGYPVMLWIHGGGFLQGSATQAIYDGLSWTNTATQENNSFIMVTINYRLNVMGFFAQPSLSDENGQPVANQGISDQRMAMKWVQDNIGQFGGDPTFVTLMGESAGSQSVCFHMVSPSSTGLFHAGIMDSGPCDTLSYLRDKSFTYSTVNELASIVGCDMMNSTQQLACLQAVDSTLLVAAAANVTVPPSTSLAFKDLEKVGGVFPFSPIVDGVEIPIHPLLAFLSGAFNRVPILTGANHDEFLLRLLYDKYFYAPNSTEDYSTRVLPIISYNNSQIQALYDPSQFNGNYTQAYVALLSQGVFLCGARRMAGYMNGQSTYLYTYTHAPELYWLSLPSLTIWPGAYHTAELFSLFQTLAATLYGDDVFVPDELPLATSLRQYWTNMITKSQPNNNISFLWPPYMSNSDQMIVLNKNMTSMAFIDMYPNCDLISDVQVSIFAEYLGLNATCIAGNRCFLVNTTTSTSPTTIVSSTSDGNKQRYCLLLLLFCYFSFILRC